MRHFSNGEWRRARIDSTRDYFKYFFRDYRPAKDYKPLPHPPQGGEQVRGNTAPGRKANNGNHRVPSVHTKTRGGSQPVSPGGDNRVKDAERFWKAVLKLTESRMSKEKWHLYGPRLRPTRLLNLRSGEFVVYVPNTEFRGWLCDNAKDLLIESVRATGRHLRDLKFVVDEPTDSRRADNGSKAPPLPEWMPKSAWDRYLEMRASMSNRPITQGVIQQLISKLDELRGGGHDPEAVLNQSVRAGWSEVYPIHA